MTFLSQTLVSHTVSDERRDDQDDPRADVADRAGCSATRCCADDAATRMPPLRRTSRRRSGSTRSAARTEGRDHARNVDLEEHDRRRTARRAPGKASAASEERVQPVGDRGADVARVVRTARADAEQKRDAERGDPGDLEFQPLSSRSASGERVPWNLSFLRHTLRSSLDRRPPSSFSAATKPDKNCSSKRCASSTRRHRSRARTSNTSTSRSRAAARRRTRRARGGRRDEARTASGSKPRRSRPKQRRRRLAQRDPAPSDRRQSDRAHRPQLPGVRPVAGIHAPISVVRMAVGDAYGAKEWREGEGDDEVALPHRSDRAASAASSPSTRSCTRARWAPRFSADPKYTVSPVYEGMLKEEMDAAAARHPDVAYEPQLIDATYALLISTAGDAAGHPVAQSRRRLPLRPGHAALRLDRRRRIGAARPSTRELKPDGRDGRSAARHRAAALREERRQPDGDDPGRRRAALVRRRPAGRQRLARDLRGRLEAVREGTATADLGGHATTTEFTDAVIEGVRRKLDVWSTL